MLVEGVTELEILTDDPPAERYSHAGYLPEGPKQAVLEIDYRDGGLMPVPIGPVAR